VFLGHFAVALGAKRAMPHVSLAVLFLAAQLADLIWPVLVLLGIETVAIDPGNTAFTPLHFIAYPYSHSLLGLAMWSVLAAVTYVWFASARLAAALAVAFVGLSHWPLDALSHRPDLPLTFSDTSKVGLGLWNSVPATLAVELPMFVVASALYARGTRPLDRVGTLGLASLVVFLVIVYAVAAFGPPPPSATAVAITAQSMWLLILWAAWIDRHRRRARPNGGSGR
jgi:hypothetical protein